MATPTLDRPDWASINAIFLGVGAFALAQGLTYPLIALLMAANGASETLIGANAAVFAVGLISSTLVLPMLTRRFDAATLIVAGLASCVICLIGLAVSSNLVLWFLLRFALGFGVNVIYVVGEAWLNAACPNRIRGRVVGAYTGFAAIGFVIGPLAVPVFGTENGFGFAACAATMALAAFLFAFMSRNSKVRPAPAERGGIAGFIRTAPVLVLLVVAVGFWDSVSLSVLPVFFLERGMTEAGAALTVSASALGLVLAQPLLGLMLDRLRKRLLIVVCLLLTAIGFVIMAVLPVQTLLIWVIIAGVGATYYGLYTCALAVMGEEFSGGLLVSASSAFALAYAIGGVAGPSITGVAMTAFGLTAAPIICAGMAVFVLALTLTRR